MRIEIDRLVFGVCLCMTCAACTKAQGQAEVKAIPSEVSCAVDVATLVLTGQEDPPALARDCGMTLDQLIAILGQRSDAPAQRVLEAARRARASQRP